MRTLNRNKSPFWYLLYDSKVPAKDEYGNETGEELVVYKPAVAMNANISGRAAPLRWSSSVISQGTTR